MTLASRLCSTVGLGTALVLALGSTLSALAQTPPLVPRTVLFRVPDHSSPTLSPDGTQLTWIAPTNGIPNLWVRSLTTNDTRLLSLDPRGSVRQPTWQTDSLGVLYLQEVDPSGTLHVMQSHVPSGIIRDLTPFTGVQGRIVATSSRWTNEMLVSMNLRDRRHPDVYRIHLRSGAIAVEAENSGEVLAWYADDDLQLRLAQIVLPNGDLALATRSDSRAVWRPLLRCGPDDVLGRVFGFGPGQSNAFVVASVRATAPRLLALDLNSGNASALALDARYEISAALFHPTTHAFEAAQFSRARAQWQLAQTNLLPDFEILRRHRSADLDILSRDAADRFWTVSYTSADTPILYGLYDRLSKAIQPLFSERPSLESAKLGITRPIAFSARDGLALEGYLTVPNGAEPRGLPAVLLVHGGPWSRVLWGFDPEVQWLANRGYAVVQVNFRGSSGYGKDHLNAGNKEWGGKILQDLVDAKDWAVSQGFIDSKRTAIMGAGFGGYATLAAMARYPDVFAAGISIGGPPDLATMVRSVPPGATSARALLEARVGHPERDAPRLTDHSPKSRAAFIRSPLLVAATAHDPQSPAQETDAFVAAIRREGRNVEYLFFPEEAGTIRNPISQLRFYAAAEAFLARYLGGRSEPPAAIEQYESLRR